jgi:hypothetical protein
MRGPDQAAERLLQRTIYKTFPPGKARAVCREVGPVAGGWFHPPYRKRGGGTIAFSRTKDGRRRLGKRRQRGKAGALLLFR